MVSSRSFLILVLLLSKVSWGQTAPQGDILSARSYLESLIVKRYSQELSTRLTTENYRVAASLQIEKVKPQSKNDKIHTDLDLTYLNPEELYRSYSGEDELTKNYLNDFLIKKVDVYLGLKENLGEDTTKELSEWFKKRVTDDFGKMGVGTINKIILQKDADVPPNKTWLEQVKELQSLAGQALLALAILIGIILWKIMSGNAKNDASGLNVSNKLEMHGQDAGDKPKDSSVDSTTKKADEAGLIEKLEKLTEQVNEIAPQVTGELEVIIKEWCLAGKDGILQVISLAEAAGKKLGRLPIPDEFREEVSETFKKVQKLTNKEKLESLRRVYWDLLASLNLGSQALHKPFSFVGGAPTGTVSEVLLKNNKKMQTIVSLFMSNEQRKDYLKNLSEEQKLELLNTAADLKEISEKELLKMENDLSHNFVMESKERSVSLSSTLTKIVDSLNIIDSCTLLKQIKGPVMQDFKQQTPSLAFLDEWPDEALKTLLKTASNEEILNYLKIRSDLKDRALNLVPPMTRIILSDDVDKPNMLKENEQVFYLESFLDKVRYLVVQGEIDLKEIFKNKLEVVPNDNAA
ncbi:MAG: hypothetical protein H6625_03175 [Bdellovibrionaceae bacterium]|nr:hypothetical protein [Pseudobdellovibrionaceae bacterium]